MKIQVAPGIYWDTEASEQSPEAMGWYQSQVLPKREDVEPTLDKWGRPSTWVIDMTVCDVEITREYVSRGYSWAMRREVINVKTK